MTSAESFSEEAFESDAGMDDFAAAFDEMEAWEADEEAEALEFVSDDLDALDGFSQEDDFAELFGEDVEGFEEDGFDGFERSQTSGLYIPSSGPRLVSGPAAVALARGLNPFVLESVDADDAEAFFRRIARGLRGAVRGVARGVQRVVARAAAAPRVGVIPPTRRQILRRVPVVSLSAESLRQAFA
ncbi:hypothetical protein [Stigmatella aurantiaca]|uniref:Uncharacterized protein n=1 Tax=Stigmatella aurantiaca (strain DW4/3-1) TaxID=378806 RepID=Q099R8_STIAD|nr:hypothetical protein [Stigmatella aurantiaca]ADO75882.1 uncharacterized protein STAUR_8127 [Stigmatella aurantiaca DW4/3-1]EAU68464.1 hypothetical protein STIAU_3278 [Stigmatella aurantiaca DW4/3-1]